MESFLSLDIDWKSVLLPHKPLLETFVRGTFVYLALFTLLRVVLKREAGKFSITDLLVVVLLADAAQNAMAGEYRSVADGILLVGTIILWSFSLNWVGYHYPAFRRFTHPRPLLLVLNGKIQPNNLRKEFITEDELMSQLREQGIEDISKVKEAYMEGDGKISVIEQNGG